MHMSGNELEELLDENQRMRSQRKWGLVALGPRCRRYRVGHVWSYGESRR